MAGLASSQLRCREAGEALCAPRGAQRPLLCGGNRLLAIAGF